MKGLFKLVKLMKALGLRPWITGCTVLSLFVVTDGAELPAQAYERLGSMQFKEREAAQADLLTWGRSHPDAAMTELLRHSRAAPDPEVRKRCWDTLRELVMDQYLKEGEGYLGIGLQTEMVEVPGEVKARSAIRVLRVQPDTPAAKAGLRENDLIVSVNEEMWPDPIFREKIRTMKPDTRLSFSILREGKLMPLKVTLGRRPLIADAPFFNGQPFDPEPAERAAKEAYFRRWLSLRRPEK